jgi:hypothetical protein
MRCKTCGKTYTSTCDYNQGRCPLHPPVLDFSKLIGKLLSLLGVKRWTKYMN